MPLGKQKPSSPERNQAGVVDTVLTEDVDAFVFGAKTIIRV